MSKEERAAAKRAAEALAALPPNKREYMLGYWDGVIAAGDGREAEPESNDEEVSK